MNSSNNGDDDAVVDVIHANGEEGLRIANRGYQAPVAEEGENIIQITDKRFQQVINDDEEVAGFILYVSSENLCDFWVEERDMMKATRVCDVIGNSTRLRRIEIYEFSHYIDEDDDDDYNPFDRLRDFFRGLVRNRSIEHFALLDISFPWNPFERLSPFFEHNHNLRCIELVYIDLPEFFESFLTTISSIEKSQLERVAQY